MLDVANDTLQCMCMFFKDGIDELPQIFGKRVAAFVGRDALRVMLTSPLPTTRSMYRLLMKGRNGCP
jgi:hypothetical protein